MDEKIAVMDTVDANFKDEWLENVARVLDGAKPVSYTHLFRKTESSQEFIRSREYVLMQRLKYWTNF